MNSYMAFKHLHLLAVALLGLLFLYRGVLLQVGSPMLQARPLRIMPHVLATVLLLAGLAMLHTLGGLPAWVLAKLLLLPVFILCGVMAFQRADKRSSQLRWFVLGLLTYGLIVAVAVTRQPLGLPG